MDQDGTCHGGMGLGPGHIVLDEEPALPPPKKGQSPNFRPIFIVAWIKMPLGTEVGLSLRE